MAKVVVASAARTTTGNSGVLQAEPGASQIGLFVDITAASGTSPTLDLSVEWSADGTNFVAPEVGADTFTQKTTTGRHVKAFSVVADTYRVVWTIGGTTPSFTFSVREHTIRSA